MRIFYSFCCCCCVRAVAAPAAGQAEAWRAEAAALQADTSQAALALSQARRAAAGALSEAVQGCLSQLAMGSSRFAVDISWTPAGQAEQQVRTLGGLLLPVERLQCASIAAISCVQQCDVALLCVRQVASTQTRVCEHQHIRGQGPVLPA